MTMQREAIETIMDGPVLTRPPVGGKYCGTRFSSHAPVVARSFSKSCENHGSAPEAETDRRCRRDSLRRLAACSGPCSTRRGPVLSRLHLDADLQHLCGE